jgi:hypothetical protein
MIKVPGAIEAFLTEDHARLRRALTRAESGGPIDPEMYAQFRQGLLRHIAMEEKVLLPHARDRRGGEPIIASAFKEITLRPKTSTPHAARDCARVRRCGADVVSGAKSHATSGAIGSGQAGVARILDACRPRGARAAGGKVRRLALVVPDAKLSRGAISGRHARPRRRPRLRCSVWQRSSFGSGVVRHLHVGRRRISDRLDLGGACAAPTCRNAHGDGSHRDPGAWCVASTFFRRGPGGHNGLHAVPAADAAATSWEGNDGVIAIRASVRAGTIERVSRRRGHAPRRRHGW